MFKKIIKISVPIILIGIILLISYNAYQETQDTTQSPITVIPTESSMILQLNNVKNLSRSLKLSEIWNKLEKLEKNKTITENIKQISEFYNKNQTIFTSNRLFISFHKVSATKNATLFSILFNRETLKENKDIISLFANDITISKYDNEKIYFSNSLGKYFSFNNDILFYSENKMLITDAIRISKKNTDNLFNNPLFSDCYSTISRSADINLMINYNNLFAFSNTLTKSKSKLTHFSEWIATDLKIKNNAILASGLSSLNNSVNNFTDIFNTQKSQNLEILNIIPEHTTKIFAISFKNQQKIYEKKNEILRKQHEFRNWNLKREWLEDSLNLNYKELMSEISNEAGIFNTSSTLSQDKTYTYIKTQESIRAVSLLQSMIISSYDYKNFRINKIIDQNLISNLFGPLFKAENSFFTTIDDYLIFGKSLFSIEHLIDNYTTNNTLTNTKSFQNLSSYISKDANIFLYLNPGKTAETLKNKLIDSERFTFHPDSISKFTSFCLQINTSNNGMLHNLCLFYDDQYKESIKEEWSYPLDTTPALKPQFVENHFTNEQMILIQDKYYNLIALNSNGEKLWSKQIGNKILGKINFIDTYKNKKFQALFNTKDQLYLIDRNGNFVNDFPKNLPFSTSMGHSLFDYNNNKNYRIIIVGNDNTLYNLNKKGENVKGWKYTKGKSRINQNPIHFSVNNKDYILHTTKDNQIKLLARNGTDRTVFKITQPFSTPVKISKNGILYAITLENKLWIGNVSGSTEIIEIADLNNYTKILAYNNGYYITNENSISYVNSEKSKKIDIKLDTPVEELSWVEGYITITTKNNLYLIKEDKVVEGFPIISESYFNISDIDNNGKINVVNIKNRSLYNYEIIN